MTTINAQNALQIRQQPMDVYISFQTGSSATISAYNVTSTYKSNDNTLDETAWPMRKITDLAGGGFPLDGSHELFDSSINPSPTDGKLGVRGETGSNVVIQISSATTITSLTIATKNASTIDVDGETVAAIGLNVISLNATSATLTITPTDADSRILIDYIVPGIILQITNSNLINCTLALRSDLSAAEHTWQESEIEVEVYYPYSIADSFAYVQNDWPITYRAGYDADLSPERKFYLSEPITQENNIITIHGVDASHWLEDSFVKSQWYTSKTNAAHKSLFEKVEEAITSAGITIERKNAASGTNSGTTQYSVIPEMTAREFVAGVMNLTLNHKRSGSFYGIQFVDAGIPTLEFGDGTTYGNAWSLNKSDCGEWAEQYAQNIGTIKNANSERKFAETFTLLAEKQAQIFEQTKVGEVVEATMDGYYQYSRISYYTLYYKIKQIVTPGRVDATPIPAWMEWSAGTRITLISQTPERVAFKINTATDGENSRYAIKAKPSKITGGVNIYTNPNGLPGITVETDPFIYGNITDGTDPVFNYQSLFKRSNHTISFTYKGDPRMQPLDFLAITDDVDGGGTIQYRITSIELSHESGGTQAKIEAREWDDESFMLLLGDDNGDALADDNGDAISIID